MPQTKYQVTLAVDGKHAVSVQSDDPAAVAEGLIWAQDTCKRLVRLSQQSAPSGAEGVGRAEMTMTRRREPELNREDAETGAPMCGDHQMPMVWVDRNGGFWSCHEKNPDSSWCTYRPPRPRARPRMVAAHG